MPVVTFNIPESQVTPSKGQRLIQAACEHFAKVLDAPVDRIRAYINLYPSWAACTGNSPGGVPFYQFYVLEDRTSDQVAELHQGFAELVAECLGVEQKWVRGACIRVAPADWGIAGAPASDVRKVELQQRQS